MVPFRRLPSEILLLIVEYIDKEDLYACTLTNKQLHGITNPLLWQLPEASVDEDTFPTYSTIIRHPVGGWIQTLKLYFNFWTDVRLLALTKRNISQVEELHLIYTDKLTEKGLARIPQRCPKLKTVYLLKVPNVTQRFMDALGHHCPQLCKLDFDMCGRLQGDTYSALQTCPIQAMYISSPPPALQTEMAMWDLVVHYPYLTELKMCMRYRDGDMRWMNRVLSAAVHAWPYLTTLALHNYGTVNSIDGHDGHDPLVDFLQSHLGIQRLYLRNNSMSDRTWDAMAALILPCLEELTITHSRSVTPQFIRQMIQNCPQLVFILLYGCNRITTRLFPELGLSCPKTGRRCPFQKEDHMLHHLDREDIQIIRHNGLPSSFFLS